MVEDTIFALASGRGTAGIAVFRISGPRADAALAALGGGKPPARVATLVKLRDLASGALLDEALALRFPAPASFTGEDVVELHVHGGVAVIEALARALGGIAGLRAAEAGEFSRRAFINGKLDLTQVEALADLVAAETEAQRSLALEQYGGALSRRFADWRSRLIGALAEIEAAVDFSDEEVPAEALGSALARINETAREIEIYSNDRNLGERLRSGFQIAILGAPNVGKSSLLNALARRDAAIVSEMEGTTRDVIEVHLDLGGLAVVVADTAGLRQTADRIEAEGVRRAVTRAEAADLRLLVCDAQSWPELDAAIEPFLGPGSIVVLNKADLLTTEQQESLRTVAISEQNRAPLLVSARNGDGMDRLIGDVEGMLQARLASLGPAPLTRERHRQALGEAAQALQRALAVDRPDAHPELVAEEVRLATRALGKIAGKVDVEDVLDRIFSQFCIGK